VRAGTSRRCKTSEARISAPLEAEERKRIVERRIAFEREPAKFVEGWSSEQTVLREKIAGARERFNSIECSGEMLTDIGAAIRRVFAPYKPISRRCVQAPHALL
jgi:Mg-chelatase subunit ChlI